jgi:single-stranded DNA-binding protein
MNLAVIRGSLSRDPELRELPSGDRIVHYEVTVRDRTPAESVNVVWVEPNAGWESVVSGDEVVVAGRVRRRFFQIAGRTTSRTEVVAERVVPARQARRVRALLDRALAAIDAADE